MKRRIYVAMTIPVLVLLAFLAFRWAERSGKFDLIAVRVDSSGPVDSALVAEILKPYFGCPLQTIDTDSLQESLLSIEGLRGVSLMKCYPHTMIVTMQPEQPAAVIHRDNESYPVTSHGVRLPSSWASDTLPVLSVAGCPEGSFIDSGLGLLIKRRLPRDTSVTVEEYGITVVDNGIPVLLDGGSSARCWKIWEGIRTSVQGSVVEVDLRYIGQAVIRRAGEGSV